MFDPTSYGSIFAPLLAEERLNDLGPGSPNQNAFKLLQALNIEQAFNPHEIKNSSMASGCLAGLWLYHDGLEESHRISQGISTTTGSFWHGIMHRREPDSWNSKYWFDRVGHHPIFPDLCEAAKVIAQGESLPSKAKFLLEQTQWNPDRFIDLCESARLGQVNGQSLCQRIQLREWQLLFDYCYRQAIGTP